MLKYVRTIIDHMKRRNRAVHRATVKHWWRDPLTHPAVRKMSREQLADLPFDARDISE